MAKPTKVRIDIIKVSPADPYGMEKAKYDVNLWVFERKTGRTVFQNKAASYISWKEATELKRDLKEAYDC